jgi:fumarylacetoacetate (FAA) hydrolase family protein
METAAKLFGMPVSDLRLPEDGADGALLGRIWLPGEMPGPALVRLDGESVRDITTAGPTAAELLNAPDPLARLGAAEGAGICGVAELLDNSRPGRRAADLPHLLAPVDLQVIKASGVTFTASLMERVIEEQARGEAARAEQIRRDLGAEIGSDLSPVRPGSETAARLKEALVARGLWSQYLEVGIGPDAELFTKAPVLSAVGAGAEVGIHPASSWNNPEPEVALIVNNRGAIVGATLANDVNLRDVEGRSALLLGRAKDNNASCALGPFIRLFDQSFSLDDVREMEINLRVEGSDGYVLEGQSLMREISRDPEDLTAQAIGANHQYPDGLVLLCGTMFAPIEDRGEAGQGFTHHEGDVVTITSAKLGALVNTVTHCDKAPPWEFGLTALMRNLAIRNLLK